MRKRTAIRLAVFCAAALLLSGCAGTETEEHQARVKSNADPGWQQIDDQTCYILADGTRAIGWLEADGKSYYLRSNGDLVTGWLSLEGQKYYLDETGAAVTGILEVDGAVYLFDETGMLTTDRWAEVDGKRCYGDINGHPISGWLETEEGLYYLDENGAAVTGWLELDGHTYYLTEDGSAAAGRLTIDGQEHCFAANGEAVLLVNPWNFLPEDYTVELTGIGGGHQISVDAYDDFTAMMADCKTAGLNPVVRSSYRTQTDQAYLHNQRISRFVAQGYSTEEATEKAKTIVAIPGTSEHQLGLALDIVDRWNQNLDKSQAETPTQQWLMENSWRYGWILRYPDGTSESTGIIYEPWHYRYVGREIAADIHASGLCLEDYLDMLTAQ